MAQRGNFSSSDYNDENMQKTNLMVSCENNAHELLKCLVCTTIMSPPTHQCSNGHIFCSNCQIKVKSCPICHISTRSLVLEIIVEPLEVPYDCPCDDGLSKCSVTCNIPKLVAHLKDDHNVKMHDGSKINLSFVLSETHHVTSESHVFNCYGRQFCLQFQAFLLGRAPCYIAFLGFVGEETEANNFNYLLEIGGNGRKSTFQRDSFMKIRGSLDGMVIPRGIAFSFSSGNTKEVKLNIKGILKQVPSSNDVIALVICIVFSRLLLSLVQLLLLPLYLPSHSIDNLAIRDLPLFSL